MMRKIFVDIGTSIAADRYNCNIQDLHILQIFPQNPSVISQVQAPCLSGLSAPVLALFISSSFSEVSMFFLASLPLLVEGPLPGMPLLLLFSFSICPLCLISLPSSGPVSNKTILALSELSLLMIIVITTY